MKSGRLCLWFAATLCFAGPLTVALLRPMTGSGRKPIPQNQTVFGPPKPAGAPPEIAGPKEASDADLRLPPPDSSPVPGLEEILKATGFDRLLLMARFIRTASPDQLAAAIDRDLDERAFESPGLSGPAFLRWLEIDREGALRHNPTIAGWSYWSRLQPQEALAAALKSFPGRLPVVISSLSQTDPALARLLLDGHPLIDRKLLPPPVDEAREKSDPATVALESLAKKDGALRGIFSRWMSRDAGQALEWMHGLSDPPQRRMLEETAITKLSAGNPAAALTEAGRLPAGGRQVDLMTAAIAALAAKDPDAALSSAKALPSAFSRQRLLAEMIEPLSTSRPEQAKALIAEIDWTLLTQRLSRGETGDLLTDIESGTVEVAREGDDSRDGLPDKILARLAASQPEAMVNALSTLHSDAGREAFGSALGTWTAGDPEAASAWLRDQPAGAARDQGIRALTHWQLYRNPEPDYAAALTWAGTASPPERAVLLRDTVRLWRKNDPAAAAEAVSGLDISGDLRAALLEMTEP